MTSALQHIYLFSEAFILNKVELFIKNKNPLLSKGFDSLLAVAVPIAIGIEPTPFRYRKGMSPTNFLINKKGQQNC